MRITDLHMHIVPGVDDGSLNMSMSLDMLEIAYAYCERIRKRRNRYLRYINK